MKGVFAPAGTLIPGTGLDLKKGVIRGVDSNGMLCSSARWACRRTMTASSICRLTRPSAQPSPPCWAYDDPLIDISLTPDRADCLGVRGIARDLAAAGLGP